MRQDQLHTCAREIKAVHQLTRAALEQGIERQVQYVTEESLAKRLDQLLVDPADEPGPYITQDAPSA
jgi:hypothetical protein